MARGEVYHYYKYKFPDGTERNKFMVQLNDWQPGKPLLFALTTSKFHGDNLDPGCNPSRMVYYLLKGTVNRLTKETLLKFDNIIPFEGNEYFKARQAARLQYKDRIDDEEFNLILKCICAMEEDIEKKYFKLIIGDDQCE